MAEIVLDNVSKVFSGGVVAVDGVSLTIDSGEFLVLVGPSGCGKSTLLRMIAGLEEATGGTISIGEQDVTELPPRARDIAMVFQSYALYPHMTVRQNLGYGLKVRKTPKREIAERVERAAQLLGLDQLLDRKPAALSGGQRQRVAMGRAIVREPKAFLMDEPLSNLDAKLRVSMRAQLAALHSRLATTTIYVTHDQIEAMTLGQRVAVMRNGRIQQVDTPQELYARPTNLFVAAFIGSPAMNLVEAEIAGGQLRFGDYAIPLAGGSKPPDGQVIAGLRPEAFEDAAFAEADLPRVDVKVEVVEELGADTHVLFTVAAPRVEVSEVRDASGDEDATLTAVEGSLFTTRVDPGTSARPGAPLRLAVDPSRFHYFDRETGLRVEPARELATVAT
ncbi:MAG TPA: sn-glycerol-3-phosphate ABC transporter ATP-binding protein UgpC [Gaiellaceae bacterium]|jgi:multiple sugar transport system ATP-binding protein|nr:sn-glycerol-3-phosphate ABC transporter ATP-binding protein UgpC [Gaiellaceae bacterium]